MTNNLQNKNGTFSRIRYRVLLPLLLTISIIIFAGIYFFNDFFQQQQTQQLHNVQQRIERDYDNSIVKEANAISGLLRVIVEDKAIQYAWLRQDRNLLYRNSIKHYKSFNSAFNITHFYYHRPDALNFLRVHHINRSGDKIERVTLQQAMITHQIISGLELGVFGQLVLRVVQPWYIEGKLVGYIELGKEIEHITNNQKIEAGVEQIIFIKKNLVVKKDWQTVFGKKSHWDTFSDYVVATSTLDILPKDLDKIISFQDQLDEPVMLETNSQRYLTSANSLYDISGQDVGFTLILHDTTLDSSHLNNNIKNIILISLFVTAILFGVFYYYLGRIQDELEKTYDALSKKIHEQKHAEAALQKQQEELKASNRELESYSYSIAHDLRSPLRAITSFSQIVLEEENEKISLANQKHLQRVIGAGIRMSDLIEDILKLSRITRKELKMQDVNLSQFVVDFKKQYESSSEPHRDIDWIIQDHVHTVGDPRLLKLVIDHLLDNAIKYLNSARQLRIEFGHIKHTHEVTYFIRDNGSGFDMQYAGKLFGAFQQLHNEEDKGTGIGLATVQRVIHRHGGRIWAEAEVNKGATFYFTLGTNSQPLQDQA